MSVILRPFKWFYHTFGIVSVHNAGRNAYLIILARACRMFAFGTNALILAIFLSALGYTDHQIGLFMTLTLLGDVILGTSVTLVADRLGRRRVLMAGSILMIGSGIAFSFVENYWILLFAATAGVISVTGGDFGPFRSIEESALSQLTTPSTRADVFNWYVATSGLGSSLGSEVSGRFLHYFQHRDGWSNVDAYHALFWIYTAMGSINALFVLCLTDACELQSTEKSYAPLAQDESDEVAAPNRLAPEILPAPDLPRNWHQKTRYWLTSKLVQISAPTRSVMYKLWFLLSVDSLADGMVPYSLTNYYMDIKFHPAKSTLGDLTSVSYFFGAFGSMFAGTLARKIGLINTMVFTHIPSSAAVLLFPFPPYFWMVAGLLLVRAGLNNMDQAPRTAFIAAVVKPEERTAVMGITAMVRTFASMAGPSVTGILAAREQFWIAYVAAGSCRLAYDFGLWALFVDMKVNQNEDRTDDVTPNDDMRRLRDEEEVLEMQSLADSESDGSSEVSFQLGPKNNHPSSGLQVSSSLSRVRSRSSERSGAKA